MRALILLSILFCSCNIDFYPIKNHLEEVDCEQDATLLSNTIDVDMNNFFCSSIYEYRSDNLNSNSKESSDFLYRKFEFSSLKDKNNVNGRIPTEETYLYLDEFDKRKEVNTGTAIYFLAYPLATKEKRRKYFSTIEAISMEIMRDIFIGEWELLDDKLYIIIPDRKKNIILFEAQVMDSGIGLERMTHPSAKRKWPENALIEIENEIRNAVFIDLKDVLALPDSEFIYFERQSERSFQGPHELNEIQVDLINFNLYFNQITSNDCKQYKFRKKNLYFPPSNYLRFANEMYRSKKGK